MIGRAGLQAAQGYQSASQLQLAGGKEGLQRLPREEAEVMELVGPGRFRVSTDDGAVEEEKDLVIITIVMINGRFGSRPNHI